MSILIEQYAGKFPLWLSPTQVKIITVTDRNIPFAQKVLKELRKYNLRAELNADAETLGKKVRDAQLEKVNYMVTIGDKEVEKKTLAIRTRDGKVSFGIKVDDFIKQIKEEISSKAI